MGNYLITQHNKSNRNRTCSLVRFVSPATASAAVGTLALATLVPFCKLLRWPALLKHEQSPVATGKINVCVAE